MKDGAHITVSNAKGARLQATVVHVFERDDANPSSSTAATFSNMAQIIFQQLPRATRAALIVSRRPIMLFLVEVAHRWFDIAANPVTVQEAA
jgi:hypothetical protein